MAISEKTKELWVDWTHDAASQYEPPEGMDSEDIAGDMVDFVTDYADWMLEEYEKRFVGSGKRPSRRRKKRREEEEEEEEEER